MSHTGDGACGTAESVAISCRDLIVSDRRLLQKETCTVIQLKHFLN